MCRLTKIHFSPLRNGSLCPVPRISQHPQHYAQCQNPQHWIVEVWNCVLWIDQEPANTFEMNWRGICDSEYHPGTVVDHINVIVDKCNQIFTAMIWHQVSSLYKRVEAVAAYSWFQKKQWAVAFGLILFKAGFICLSFLIFL